jgi:hypothetical protein
MSEKRKERPRSPKEIASSSSEKKISPHLHQLICLKITCFLRVQECEADPLTKSGEGAEQLAKCRAGLVDFYIS